MEMARILPRPKTARYMLGVKIRAASCKREHQTWILLHHRKYQVLIRLQSLPPQQMLYLLYMKMEISMYGEIIQMV